MHDINSVNARYDDRLRKYGKPADFSLVDPERMPTGYVPPASVDELEVRCKAGQRYFAEANLSNMDLTGLDFRYLNFRNVDFTGSNLCGANFLGCIFDGVVLESVRCDEKTVFPYEPFVPKSFRNADLTGVAIETLHVRDFQKVDFTNCCLKGATFFNCDFSNNSTLRNSKELRHAYFYECKMENVDLSKLDLSGAYFSLVILSGASFVDTNIEYANFFRSGLSGAKVGNTRVSHANFEHADLSGVDLAGLSGFGSAKLSHATFIDSDFTTIDLSKLNLSNTYALFGNFKGAKLFHTDLSNSMLSHADFSGAVLPQAIFSGAKVKDADFGGADLRGCIGLEFDANNIRGARLPGKAKDSWSTLRRNYTGSRFAFHLVILLFFVGPYLLRTTLWLEVNWAQEGSTSIRAEAAKRLNKMTVDTLIESSLPARINSPCLAEKCTEWKLWQLLLGFDRPLHAIILAMLLLIYNAARLVLTWKVGPLREDEDRTGITPAASEYRLLFKLHRVFSVILYIALASMAYHLYIWLMSSILLPVGAL